MNFNLSDSKKKLALAGVVCGLVAAALGAVLYRVIISEALYLGMESSDLKLVSAVIVAVALYLGLLGEKGAKIRKRRRQNGKAAANS